MDERQPQDPLPSAPGPRTPASETLA
jgi:hypothetical protein